jgi:thiol-disulfide isomerase/thioredoxin
MVTDITMNDMVPGGMPEDDSIHVIMFYGPTCGPCKSTIPYYEQASDLFTLKGANVKFHKIDAWNPPEQKTYCNQIWGINGVPHFKSFCKGQVISEKVGGGNYEAMFKMIHETIDEAFKRFGEKY